jgi:hypothetical protein
MDRNGRNRPGIHKEWWGSVKLWQGPSLVGTSNLSFICMYSSFGGGEGMFDEGEGDDPKGCDAV